MSIQAIMIDIITNDQATIQAISDEVPHVKDIKNKYYMKYSNHN